MRNDLTDIVVVMDRSGSMADCQAQAEEGLNTFIRGQKEGPGVARLTLVQFDTEYEVVVNGVNVRDVNRVRLEPRGGTALLDAVGRAITDTGRRLAALPEHERPGLVLVAIVTDGYENASRIYSRSRVKEMIEHQRSKYNWQFTFLGANQDSFAEARTLGIAKDATINYSTESAQWGNAVNSSVLRCRLASLNNETVATSYTDAERLAAMSQEK